MGCTPPNGVTLHSYLLLLPVLYMFAKSSSSAIQSILHALFVPTPFKRVVTAGEGTKGPLEDSLPEEVLKPGALYTNCSAVLLGVKVPEIARMRRRKTLQLVMTRSMAGKRWVVWFGRAMRNLSKRGVKVFRWPKRMARTRFKKNN